MLAEIRQEILPILIVGALLVGALRYWILSVPMPEDLSLLVTAVVMFYFGSRTGANAATRAINGAAREIELLKSKDG